MPEPILQEVEAEPPAHGEPTGKPEDMSPNGASVPAATGEDAGPPPEEGADGAPPMVPVSALVNERRRRQEAERQLAGRAGEPEPEHPAAAFAARAGAGALAGEVMAHLDGARLGLSEQAARNRHPDFDARLEAFARMAEAQPALLARMGAAPDPAEFAYRAAGGGAATAPPPPESLSGARSAGSTHAAPWRPKSLNEIVRR